MNNKNNNEVNAVVFDLFGVILSSGFESAMTELESLFGIDYKYLKPVYEKWEIPFDKGEINSKQFWDKISKDLQMQINWKQANNTVLNSYKSVDQTIEVVKRYKDVLPLYLMSNTRSEWYKYLDNKFNFSRYFVKEFLSFEYGIIKPNPNFYKCVIDYIGIPRNEIIYIDDKLENVHSGKKLIPNSIQFHNSYEVENLINKMIGKKAPKYDKFYSGALIFSNKKQLILQKRENKKGISNPGLITTFGGIRNIGESSNDCLKREIEEELSILINDSNVSQFVKYGKQEENGQWTECNFKIVQDVDVNCLQLNEGQKIIIGEIENILSRRDLSPVCRALINKYLRTNAN